MTVHGDNNDKRDVNDGMRLVLPLLLLDHEEYEDGDHNHVDNCDIYGDTDDDDGDISDDNVENLRLVFILFLLLHCESALGAPRGTNHIIIIIIIIVIIVIVAMAIIIVIMIISNMMTRSPWSMTDCRTTPACQRGSEIEEMMASIIIMMMMMILINMMMMILINMMMMIMAMIKIMIVRF